MSADLFAEFGLPQPATSNANPATTGGPRISSPGNELDIFGDPSFFQAPAAVAAPPSIEDSAPVAVQKEEPLWHQDQGGADVLFDAAEENHAEDDDEFGDFETAAPASQLPSRKATTDDFFSSKPIADDWLSSTSTANNKPIQFLASPPAPSQPVFGQLYPRHGRPKSSTISSPPISTGFDDDWGDFADAPTFTKSSVPQRSKSTANRAAPPPLSISNVKRDAKITSLPTFNKKQDLLLPDDEDDFFASNLKPVEPKKAEVTIGTSIPTVQTDELRPTNVPPPSVLLQLFPPLFERLYSQASTLKSSGKPQQVQNQTVDELVQVPTVAGRIIAGRTLRWKRDTRLSQATKIGPAHSGRGGGMKLNSVNKSEDVREKREAADVVEAWRRRAFQFNSAATTAGRRPVGVISETMPVRVEEGAIKAAEACALCALKREERISSLDGHVEDSFGEWWVEHWGHTDCKRFWEKHKGALQQR